MSGETNKVGKNIQREQRDISTQQLQGTHGNHYGTRSGALDVRLTALAPQNHQSAPTITHTHTHTHC